MNNTLITSTQKASSVEKLISRLFGGAVMTMGFINMFGGSEPGFGVFLVMLSALYFIPVEGNLKHATISTVPIITIIKIILGILTAWVVFGQGQLFETIEVLKTNMQTFHFYKQKQLKQPLC